MPTVDSGNSERTQPFDEWFTCVVGVDSPQFRLNGSRLLQMILIVVLAEVAHHANYGVRINQAWRHNCRVDNIHITGN